MISHKIRQLANDNKISLKDLAKLAEISEQGLQKMLKKDDYQLSTLTRIANILNVSVESFFYSGDVKQILKTQTNQKNKVVLQIEMDENKNLRIAPGKDLFDLIT